MVASTHLFFFPSSSFSFITCLHLSTSPATTTTSTTMCFAVKCNKCGKTVSDCTSLNAITKQPSTYHCAPLLDSSLAAHLFVYCFSLLFFLNRPGRAVAWYRRKSQQGK
jgi:hypothetical protein